MRLLVALSVAVLLAGCSAPDSSSNVSTAPTPASVVTRAPTAQPVQQQNVTIKGLSFEPSDILIPVGGTVTWTNLDTRMHSIQIEDGRAPSGPFPMGQQTASTFYEVGKFAYHCEIHSIMTGVVNVNASIPRPSPPPPDNSVPPKLYFVNITSPDEFIPGSITIPVGSSVRWTNVDTTVHTASFSDFASGNLQPGDDYTHEFTRTGQFFYNCNFHTDKRGTVNVV